MLNQVLQNSLCRETDPVSFSIDSEILQRCCLAQKSASSAVISQPNVSVASISPDVNLFTPQTSRKNGRFAWACGAIPPSLRNWSQERGPSVLRVIAL
jgi:hypothetical protein